MKIHFDGTLQDTRRIRAGFIGCGSHSFRNIYPTFQFAPVELAAVCDLSLEKAQAFAAQFGAHAAYSDYHEMLRRENLDAVFVVTSYTENGRPRYPDIAVDCLNAGVHVWIEKPPAASVEEIEKMQRAAEQNHRQVGVGFKKMFFEANRKAKELAYSEDFGTISMASLQYPQGIPTTEEFARYREGQREPSVTWFLDHLCHPVSLMLYLFSMPETLYYARSGNGAGSAVFTYQNGLVVNLQLTCGAASNCGMERTMILSDRGRHITVENNIRVSYHRDVQGLQYGCEPYYYQGGDSGASTVWEPEFSLGQLYNKGLFLLGYYGEVNEFAQAILENRPLSNGTLEQAWQATRIFECFAEGPNRVISLSR